MYGVDSDVVSLSGGLTIALNEICNPLAVLSLPVRIS